MFVSKSCLSGRVTTRHIRLYDIDIICKHKKKSMKIRKNFTNFAPHRRMNDSVYPYLRMKFLRFRI